MAILKQMGSAMQDAQKDVEYQRKLAERDAMMKRNYEVGLANSGNVKAGDGYRSRAVTAQTAYAPYSSTPKETFNQNQSTYGGYAALYDPRTGQMLRDSSANREADRYLGMANAAQGRGAYQIDNSMANADRDAFNAQMGVGNSDRMLQLQALAQQQKSADRYDAMARGEGPSLARALMATGMNDVRAQQASAAASARGPAGLAMAQQNAAANAANAGQQLAGQMGAVRAQEQLGAMQGYAQSVQGIQNAAAGIRGQDYGAAGMYNQSRGLSQQGSIAQGQLEANQRAMNDAYQMGMENNRKAVYGAQLGANFEDRAAIDRGHQVGAGIQSGQDARTDKYVGAGVSAAGSITAMSDVRNKEDIQDISAGQTVGRGLQYAGASLSGQAPPPMMPTRAYSTASGPSAPKSSDAPKVSDDTFNMANAAQSDEPYVRLNTSGMDLNGNVPSDANAQASLASAVSDKSRFQLQDPNAYLNNQAMQMEPATYGNPMSSAYQLDVPKYAVSDENSKRKINLLSAALMKADAEKMAASQGAMYGSPSPVRAESPVQHALQNLNPYAFNYKPGIGENPNQRHVGVMAQDLETTPVGSTVVRDTPQGKVIDGKGTMMLSLAAAADLQKQVDKLKAEQEAMYGAQPAIQPKGSY